MWPVAVKCDRVDVLIPVLIDSNAPDVFLISGCLVPEWGHHSEL
jgi:hypothetical protein